MTNVDEATTKNETAEAKKPSEMTVPELLAYAAGSGESNPTWKLVLGARETAQMIRAAVFFDGTVDERTLGLQVSPEMIDRMFARLDRELEALEELLLRQRCGAKGGAS